MKADERKQQILDSALKAFAQHGYERTSIAVICECAGIARPTLYQYFKDKKSLFRELLVSKIQEFHQDIHARQVAKDEGRELSSREASDSMHLEMLKEICENRDLFTILFREAKARNAETEDIAKSITQALVGEIVREWMEEGHGPDGYGERDLEFAAVYMIGGVMQVVEYYLFDGGGKMAMEELAAKITMIESKFIER